MSHWFIIVNRVVSHLYAMVLVAHLSACALMQIAVLNDFTTDVQFGPDTWVWMDYPHPSHPLTLAP